MAINMSNVKEIHYNNKEISKIEMNGSIVWQKPASKVLQSITLAGYTTTFNVGNTFSYGGTVTANYSDGTTDDVTANTTFSGYNMSSAGTQTVTASYTEAGVTQTATYSITVYKVLTKITLSGQTTSLNRNATYSFGGTVTATYNDGSTANVTSSTTFSGYNMATSGTYTVTASYTYRSVTKTATYSLTVNPIWTTTWSGSAYSQVSTGSSSSTWSSTISNSNVLTTIPQQAMESGCKLRITWSYTWSNVDSADRYYRNNGSYTKTVPGRPFTINTASINNQYLLGVAAYDSSSRYRGYAYLNWASANRQLKLATYTYSSTQAIGYDKQVKFTITKIELYY